MPWGECKICKNSAYLRPGRNQKLSFCSNRCRIIYNKSRWILITCALCSKRKLRRKSNHYANLKKSKSSKTFCSTRCGQLAQGERITINCAICDKLMTNIRFKRFKENKFPFMSCSPECLSLLKSLLRTNYKSMKCFTCEQCNQQFFKDVYPGIKAPKKRFCSVYCFRDWCMIPGNRLELNYSPGIAERIYKTNLFKSFSNVLSEKKEIKYENFGKISYTQQTDSLYKPINRRSFKTGALVNDG